jgi:hypothetical protein
MAAYESLTPASGSALGQRGRECLAWGSIQHMSHEGAEGRRGLGGGRCCDDALVASIVFECADLVGLRQAPADERRVAAFGRGVEVEGAQTERGQLLAFDHLERTAARLLAPPDGWGLGPVRTRLSVSLADAPLRVCL